MSQLKFKLVSSTPPRKYSEAFKRKVVKEYEEGTLTKVQLMRKYQLRGKSSVLAWCRKFGKFDHSSPRNPHQVMKDPKDKLIKELQKKLKYAEEKIIVYDRLMEITNKQLDSDVKKKIEERLSEVLKQEKK